MMTCVSERSGMASSGILLHGVNAAEHQRHRRQQDDELVLERKINDALEHIFEMTNS